MENVALCDPLISFEECNSTANLTDFSSNYSNLQSSNFSDSESSQNEDSLVAKIVLSITLSLIMLLTIGGNLLVIVAILKERNLHGVGNCLVLSLAVADLMVACLVMPLAAVVEITQEWPYGPALCDIWTFCDVLCCTASILHLLAIAMDRYWAVTNIDYIRKRSIKRTSVMIAIAWGVACIVSLPPVVGWKDPEFFKRIEEKRCMVSQDIGYQVFATFSTFYVPLALTLILYWRIYKVARERIRNKPGSRVKLGTQKISAQTLAPPPIEMSALSEISTSLPESDNSMAANGTTSFSKAVAEAPPPKKKHKRKHKKESLESKREKKAAKTLAIITGVFVVCWLPFFLMALIMAFCEACEFSSQVFGFLLWLGYANSMLNPIIYTIFSPDFRSAFRRLLFGNRGRTRVVFYG